MGQRSIAELTQAFLRIQAEVNDLENIKAEVDYKDLGIDDGTAARYACSIVQLGWPRYVTLTSLDHLLMSFDHRIIHLT